MTNSIALPFTIGATMYAPGSGTEQVQIVCPVCNGDRRITVILGDGEHVSVSCDGCGLGFNGPRGYIDEWEHHPKVTPFVIAAVESFRDGEWRLKSEDNYTADLKDLYATEAEAKTEADRRAAAAMEHNMASRNRKRKGVQNVGWTVQYHRKKITDLEKELAWHRAKVLTVKAAK
jgi:hypothetical protein